MENRRNYYRILHVQHDAPGEIIRTSYRTLMQRLKMHPDLGGNHSQASLLNEAYAILSDPDRRAIYDHDRYSPTYKDTTTKNDGQNAGNNAQRPPPSGKPLNDKEPPTGHCFFCHTPHPAIEITDEDNCEQCCNPLTLDMWHVLKSQNV